MLISDVINHLNIGINPLSHQPLSVQKAIESLVKAFNDGLHNKLPRRFHLASIDCGLGKTTALTRFLYHWKRVGFQPDNGVLIITPTLDDIAPIVTNAGLDDRDYAIQTPDDRYANKGLGSENANRAKVLFITQAMLKKRLGKKKFLQASEFAYRGRPRALRVCDEGILPAEPICLSVDKLLGLVAPLRPYDEPYVEQVIAFVKMMRAAKLDTVVTVPAKLRKMPRGLPDEHGSARASLSPDQVDLIQALSMAAGRKLRLMDAKKYGRALVGYGRKLPDDLAPMIVMDASARVRLLYDVWTSDRGNLVRLPVATSSYDNLTINVWKRASGRAVLGSATDLAEIADHVAAVINTKASEKWAVVCPKDNELGGLKVATALRSRLRDPDNVGFVTWGRHVGTNAFRDCQNVVVIVAFRLPQLAYQARYMAASGRSAETFGGDEWTGIWTTELQEALLQAICRANVRNSRNGVCGEWAVHMVIGASPDPMAMMAGLFPGATIKRWDPVMPELRGQSLVIVETLTRLQAEGYISVSKGRLRELAGISNQSRFSQLLSDERLRSHIRALGITLDHGSIYLNARALAA